MGSLVTRVVASSVRGPAHIRDGLPCQDAWRAGTSSGVSFAVVCDGMGSRPNAKEGAKAATLAVRDAWRLWMKSPHGNAEDLIRLLEVIWRIRLLTVAPDTAATTCLLYAENCHGGAVMAQLGDGLIAKRGADNIVSVHTSFSEGFGRTHALGTPHTLANWSYTNTPQLATGEALILATDGVSEDLELSRLGDLAIWCINDLGSQPKPGRLLASELRNWPVPNHQDDKTLLVMWKP